MKYLETIEIERAFALAIQELKESPDYKHPEQVQIMTNNVINTDTKAIAEYQIATLNKIKKSLLSRARS